MLLRVTRPLRRLDTLETIFLSFLCVVKRHRRAWIERKKRGENEISIKNVRVSSEYAVGFFRANLNLEQVPAKLPKREAKMKAVCR